VMSIPRRLLREVNRRFEVRHSRML